MKTDLIIQQVVEKVRKEHNMMFQRMDDDWSKKFLDRYTAYAITNTRKTIMKNLKRNAPLVSNSNSKRVKKIITFDPNVHVKQEKQDDVRTMLNLEINSSDGSQHNTSTLTMDKSRDEKAKIFESFVEYFNSGGKSLNNSDDFLTVWKEHVEDITLQNNITEEYQMPPLPGLGMDENVNITTQQETLEERKTMKMSML